MMKKIFKSRLLILLLVAALLITDSSLSFAADGVTAEETEETTQAPTDETTTAAEPETTTSPENEETEADEEQPAGPAMFGIMPLAETPVIYVRTYDGLGNLLSELDNDSLVAKIKEIYPEASCYKGKKEVLGNSVAVWMPDFVTLSAYVRTLNDGDSVEIGKNYSVTILGGIKADTIGSVVLAYNKLESNIPTVTVLVRDGEVKTSLEDVNARLNELIGSESDKYYEKGNSSVFDWVKIDQDFLNQFKDPNFTSPRVIEIGYNGIAEIRPVNTFKIKFEVKKAPAETNEIAVEYVDGIGTFSVVTGADVSDGKISVSKETEDDVVVTVTPNNNYYVKSVLVGDSKVELTYSAGKATFTILAETAKTAEKITVTFGNVFELNEGEYAVSFRDGADLSAIKATLEQKIIEQAVAEGCLAADATLKVEFKSEGLTPLASAWVALDKKSNDLTGKAFGANAVEKIRLTASATDKYPETTVEFDVNVTKVPREASKLEFNEINLTYSEDAEAQKQQIFDAINWEETVPNDFTIDDIKVEYKFSLNIPSIVVNLLPNEIKDLINGANDLINNTPASFQELKDGSTIPAGTQTIRVTYNGNEDYLSCEKELTVNVAKAKATVTVHSQNINYGEEFDTVVTTEPSDVSTLTIITGVDAKITPYVSVILPKLKPTLIPTTGNPADVLIKPINDVIEKVFEAANSMLEDLLNQGGTLKDTLTAICNNELLASLTGIDLSTVTELLNYLPDGIANIKINVNQLPEDAGVYAVASVTLDPNYDVAFGLGSLVINMDSNHTLTWNEELPDILNYIKAQHNEFDFGAKFDGEESADVQYEYAGFSYDGQFLHSNEAAILVPGVYTETAYVKLGNKYACPIVRTYTVGRMHVTVENLNPTKVYDGQPMDLNEVFKVTGEDGAVVENPHFEVLYFNTKTPLIPESKAPVDAGTYTVKGIVCGDATHREGIALGHFTIKPMPIVVKVQNATKEYGEKDPDFTSIIEDEAGNVLDVNLNLTYSRKSGEDVGTYAITVDMKHSCGTSNYDITVEPGTLTITERPITVVIADQTKTYGDPDPDFTWALDKDSSLAFEDELYIALERKPSEDVDTYDIFDKEYKVTAGEKDVTGNYKIEIVPGTLTIVSREVTVTAKDATKVYGEKDPEHFDYVITGLVEGDNLNVKTWRDGGEDVDKFVIHVEVTPNKNYNVKPVDGTFEITKRPITITIDNQHKYVGKADPKFTYAITEGNLVRGDRLHMDITCIHKEKPGTYDITGVATIRNWFNDKTGNYEITYNYGKLTIEALYTVTYKDGADGKVFKDQVYAGLKEGEETPTFVGNLVRSGYTFKGWTPDVETTVTGDAVYTAVWEKKPEPSVKPEDPKPQPKPEQPAPQPTQPAPTNPVAPQTGDSMNMLLWFAIAAFAVCGAGFVFTKKRSLTTRRK